jgi:hypothetical protein
METTITFVLGTFTGAVLLGIVFGIVKLLRINKEIATMQENLQKNKEAGKNRQIHTDERFAIRDQRAKEVRQELERDLEDRFRGVYDTFQSIQNSVWKQADEVQQQIGELIAKLEKMTDESESYTDNEVHRLVDLIDDVRTEANDECEAVRRYTDKRIDKTVDVLCERMDSLNNKRPYTYDSTTPYASGGVNYTDSDTSTNTTKEVPDRIYS